jgi:hypothetical protein
MVTAFDGEITGVSKPESSRGAVLARTLGGWMLKRKAIRTFELIEKKILPTA